MPQVMTIKAKPRDCQFIFEYDVKSTACDLNTERRVRRLTDFCLSDQKSFTERA